MHIGSIARLTGTTPKAIRLYEELGLLADVQRKGSYRIYSDKNIEEVRLIRRAQTLGFRLSELKPILRPSGGEPDWNALVDHLRQKQLSIASEVDRLQQLSVQLALIAEETEKCLAQRQHGDFLRCHPQGDAPALPVA